MAKVIMPPQISSLDELLDIVVHPEKFAARLKQMIEARDAIASKLSTIQTMEEAENYLAQARETQSAAQAELTKAKAIGSEASLAKQAFLDQLTKDQDAWTKAKASEQERFTARENDLARLTRTISDRESALQARAMALDEQEAVLARLAAKLKAEQEKMDKRKELLNAI